MPRPDLKIDDEHLRIHLAGERDQLREAVFHHLLRLRMNGRDSREHALLLHDQDIPGLAIIRTLFEQRQRLGIGRMLGELVTFLQVTADVRREHAG